MSDVCGLCGLQRELKKSHFLSAGLFKAVSRGYAPYDPAPVLVNVKNRTAVQSNFQSKKKFLCAECERRFDEGGEKNVIRNCFRDNGKFELREQLETRPPSLRNANRRVWFGDLLDEELRAATFVYFAISIIWRASATEWPGETGVEPGFLSRDLEEGCREFLLGRAPLPQTIDLLVHVNFDQPPTTFLSFPMREQVDLAGIPLMSYIFHIPGVRGRYSPTRQECSPGLSDLFRVAYERHADV